MSKRNQEFSRTITYKGNLDISNIIKGLQQVRNQLNSETKDPISFINIDRDLKKVEELGNKIQAAIKKGFSNPQDFKSFEKMTSELEKTLYSVSSGLNNIDLSNAKKHAAELKKELEEQKKNLEGIVKAQKELIEKQFEGVKNAKAYVKRIVDSAESSKSLGDTQKAITGELEEQVKAQKEKIKLIKQEENSIKNNLLETNSLSLKSNSFKYVDSGKNISEVDKDNIVQSVWADTVLGLKNGEPEEISKAIKRMSKTLVEHNIQVKNTDTLTKKLNETYQKTKNALPSLQQEFKKNEKALKSTEKDLQNSEQRKQQIETILKNEEIRNSYEKITESIKEKTRVEKEANNIIPKRTSQKLALEDINKLIEKRFSSLGQVTAETKKATEAQLQYDASFDHLKYSIRTILSIGSAFRGVRQIINETFNDIKQLDKSFAEIAMVTDYSVDQMWRSYGKYAQMANELGQSTRSVIQASGLYYQQGLDTIESLELTKDTMKLATLAGTDFAESTSQMTAALRGFNMEMNEGARVTDVYSELAAKAAADVQGIAYSMSKTASIANSAGMEFETTAAFLTQMIETTQEAPENLGTAMKTVIARFTELKENVAGTANSEFDDLDYNKVDTALKSVGVSLKDTNGQFRNLDEVFLELASKWDTLSRNSQRYVATIAAGSRQQSRFIAMMENYERTIELVNVAYNSAGKASEQFAKYQDTVEYRLNQISNSWEQLRTNLFSSDTYKSALDMVNNLIYTVNNMDLTQMLTVGLIGITLGKNVIMNMVRGMQETGTNISTEVEKLKLIIQNKFTKNPLKITYDNSSIEEVKIELQNLGFETSEINSKTGSLIIQYVNLKTQIEEIRRELEQEEIDEEDINLSLRERQALLKDITNELKKQNFEVDRLENAFETENDELDGLRRRTRDSRIQLNNGTRITSEALSSSLTTFLLTSISTGDIEKAITPAIVSGLTSAIPMVINAVIPKILTAIQTAIAGASVATIATIASIAVAVVAVFGGAIYAAKQFEKAEETAHKARLSRLKNLDKIVSDLLDKQIATLKNVNNTTSQKEKLEESIEAYNTLSKKAFLTKNEQDILSLAIQTLTEDYSEVVTIYDENTEQLILNTNAINRLIDAYNEEIEKYQQDANIYQYQQILSTQYAKETAKEMSEKVASAVFDEQRGTFDILTKGLEKDERIEDYIFIEDPNGPTEHYKNEITQNTSVYEREYFKKFMDELVGAFGEDSQIFKQLGLKDSDLETVKTFCNYLEETNQSWPEFSRKFSELAKSEIQTADVVAQMRETLKQELLYSEVNGQKLSEEMASSLSYLIDETYSNALEDASELFKDKATSKRLSTNKQFLRDYLAEIQLNKDVSAGAADIEESLRVIEINGQTINADEIIKKHIDNWTENEEALFTEWDGNLQEWANLPEDFRTFLETSSSGEYSANNWDDVRKNAAKSKELLEEYFLGIVLAEIDFLSGINIEELSQADKNTLLKIENLFLTMGELTTEQYLNQLNTLVNELQDETTKQAFLRGQGLDIINGKLGFSGEKTISSSGKLLELQEKLLANQIYDTANLSIYTKETLVSLLENANLSAESTHELGIELAEIYSGLNQESSNILSSIDILNSSTLDLIANEESYVNALIDTGMSINKATEVYENYVSKALNYINKGITNLSGIQVLKDNINTHLKSVKEEYSLLTSAQQEYYKTGKISSETYFNLIEKGFDNYVKITSNGYELLTEEISNIYLQQSLAGNAAIKEEIKINEKRLAIIKSFAKNNIEISKEMAKNIGLEGYFKNSGQNTAIIDFNELLQAYQALTDEQKKQTNLFEGFDPKIADMVISATNEGYNSLEEYYSSLIKVNNELKSAEPDSWIQGMETYKTSIEELNEQIKELKEEIQDLDKELIEQNDELIEAQKKLNEAQYGTQDFRSGLDGLINYDRSLTIINEQIEELSENLNKISSLDSAQAVMEKVTKTYEDKLGILKAEGQTIEQGLKNLQQELLSNYGKYVSFDEKGILNIDFSYQQMQDSDIIKKEGFEKLVEEYNSLYDKNFNTEKEITKTTDEYNKLRSESRNKYIEMEETVIEILKQQMQEEVEAVTDKYEALEEADNDYLNALESAIEKQRKLREQENKHNDLATKEKQLSLMQRDTSGANKKETANLKKEIQDDRQEMLDDEVDNIIDSMKELYEKQQEARQLEIEAMEAAIEDMQAINLAASKIISGFDTIEDYQSWLLENDPKVIDLTKAQTEQYLEKTEEVFSGYAQYISTTSEELMIKTENVNQSMDEMFFNTSENISLIGQAIQQDAEKSKQEAIDAAEDARLEIVEKINETKDKIAETSQQLNEAEANAAKMHQSTMEEMIEASKSALEKVSEYATKTLIEFEKVDLKDSESVQKFAQKYNFYNPKTEEYSKAFINALADKGYDTSNMVIDKAWQIVGTPKEMGAPTVVLSSGIDTKAKAESLLNMFIEKYGEKLRYISIEPMEHSERVGAYRYKEGGLVDYTGYAYVDGTPQKPESFLNSEDTARIGAAAKLLADLPIFNSTPNAENAVSTNIGDTSIEIHINVESISDDYDVDQMIERVKQDIVDVAKPVGTSVILNK